MTFPTYSGQVLVEGHENLRHFEAQGSISAGQVVKTDSSTSGRTAVVANTSGEQAIGVAIEDASSGEQLAVAMEGAIVRVSPDDAVTSGNYLAVDAGTDNGEVTPAASGDAIVGVALQDSTGTNTEAGLIMQVAYGQFGD
jgi:predicted lipoprotein